MTNKDTRLKAVINAVVDMVMNATGIRITQPPLKNSGDCTVRVDDERSISQSLNRNHATREAVIVFYCKSDSSDAGITALTTIHDYLLALEEEDMPATDTAFVIDINCGSVAEENDSGDWIYRLKTTIEYCY